MVHPFEYRLLAVQIPITRRTGTDRNPSHKWGLSLRVIVDRIAFHNDALVGCNPVNQAAIQAEKAGPATFFACHKMAMFNHCRPEEISSDVERAKVIVQMRLYASSNTG